MPFEAGKLEIVANNRGKVFARKAINTATNPAQISMKPDRNIIITDGEDLLFITVKIEF
ncbi:MAG: hypothetical protein GW772_00205 [Flavobacteriia bacterium]|nr:hypothetical protein [Flavobacteriia bacterium]NCT59072.1 hypothetical protein [Flavobacteriia bacterium]